MIEIPHGELKPDTLTALLEEFVTRDGTDYGAEEIALATKVAQVRRQLEQGEAVIVYDEDSGSCTVHLRRELHR